MTRGADEAKIRRLAKEISGLSNYERVLLYERLHAGRVEIHDWFGKDRTKPRAVIYHPDSPPQTIYIIQSVEQNAASIGHPVILLAIRRWEQVVRFHQSRSRHIDDKRRSNSRTLRRPDSVKSSVGQEQITRYNLARKHLEDIGKALFQGAKKRKVKVEKTVQAYIQNALPDRDGEILKEAYSLLREASKEAKPERKHKKPGMNDLMSGFKRKLTARFFRGFMQPLPVGMKTSLEQALLQPIFDYILSDFSSLTSRLRQDAFTFDEFYNEFHSWRFNVTLETMQMYQSRAQRESEDRIDARFLTPEYSNNFALFELNEPFFFPLQPAPEDR